MTDKEKIHQMLSSLWKNNDSFGKMYYNQALQDVQTAIDLQEEPVSDDLEKAATNYATHLDKNWGTVKDGYIAENEKEAFKAGAEWQKEKLWKDAQSDNLPEIYKEVIVLTQDCSLYFAHRPNPNGWDGKSITTDKVEHYTPKIYDKGGWNIPNVKYWLDVEFPKR